MAMVLEDPAYAFDVELPSPQRQTNAREVTQDVQPANEEDSDEEIEVVAALTETELMMQRFEEAKQSGDVVELLDDDDDAEAEPSPSKMAELANHTTSACQNDDDIQFIRTTCSAVF